MFVYVFVFTFDRVMGLCLLQNLSELNLTCGPIFTQLTYGKPFRQGLYLLNVRPVGQRLRQICPFHKNFITVAYKKSHTSTLMNTI